MSSLAAYPRNVAGRCGIMLLGIAALMGCNSRTDDRTVAVSVIGGVPKLIDPDRTQPFDGDAELLRATRQGLVAFDANGLIEPALAESWTFTQDGLSVIFRVRRVKWPGGADVTAADVAASLNAAIGAKSNNRLKPLLSAIERIVAMTDRVLEIRLRVPRPNLLELLAQPDLGIRRRTTGTGPWRIVAVDGSHIALAPRGNPGESEAEPLPDPAITQIDLRGERASLAIARFRMRRGGLVIGGTLADWPIVQAAQLRTALVRMDPAQGLFGLAINPDQAFLKDVDMRTALAMAIDRNALVAAFEAPGWQPVARLLPQQFDSAAGPALPEWAQTPIDQRQAEARRRIGAWTAARGPLATLSVALPDGAGMAILFARIARDWRRIGVSAVRVTPKARDADLRLIDEVAPNRSANWYLTRTGCDAGLPCSAEADLALKGSRSAPDLARRAALIAQADKAQANFAAFIPLANPLRWSLVDPGLSGFRENSFAVHPLTALRGPQN